jgi:hypothetical protein
VKKKPEPGPPAHDIIRLIHPANMTAQRLYAIIKYIEALDQKLGIQTTLDTIRETLSNLVSSPGQPTHQNTLAGALSTLSSSVATMATSITPSQAALIHEIGGGEYFHPTIADKIRDVIERNAMTPSVAKDFVQEFTTKRATFLATIKSVRQGLEKLGIQESDLPPGSADASFLIPRELFDNELGQFAKELKFITRLVGHFTEAQTGKMEPVKLEQLSSSVPLVAIMADLGALSLLGTVVKQFLEAWQKFEEIREVRARLAKIGFKGTALKELDEQISTKVTEVIEESTTLVMAKYPGEAPRRRELENAIRKDTATLFSQIERGLTVEFRAEPKPDAEPEAKKNLEQIVSIAKVLQFPKPTNEPLLLGSGEIPDDGDEGNGNVVIAKQTKKTTSTTTEKKGI